MSGQYRFSMSNKDSNKFGQLCEQNERSEIQLAFRPVPDCRAVEAHGQEQRLPDGVIVRAVLMTSVRDSFRCGQWDGHQWLYAVVDPN
jgi:hypothetical protein